ncbi:MAG: type IV pilus modification protein PilV [Xanthomonadaceae bacterium]|nr:type IV pilus modification protein PilV [Xanthomonadaceae bacterium]
MRIFPRQRGFTLLEVLISVLVFSVGLLGVAGLMVLSVRTNHSAFLRTQASFLAESMADRMRTNLGYVDQYNGTYDSSTAGAASCASAPCTPTQLAAHDRAVWSQQLVEHLPSPTAIIACENQPPNPGYAGSQPYGGLCEMTITWTEADLSQTGGTPATQTFAWVFQP